MRIIERAADRNIQVDHSVAVSEQRDGEFDRQAHRILARGFVAEFQLIDDDVVLDVRREEMFESFFFFRVVSRLFHFLCLSLCPAVVPITFVVEMLDKSNSGSHNYDDPSAVLTCKLVTISLHSYSAL